MLSAVEASLPTYQSSNYQPRHPELESRAVEKNCLYYGDNLTVLRERIKPRAVGRMEL